MKHIKDPRQKHLFDAYAAVFDDASREELNRSWPGLFRYVILEQLPAPAMAKHFHDHMGCPTKELYSMVGLIFLMDSMDWTKEEAVIAYRYHMDVHYALNLEPIAQPMSLRTLERYIALFNEEDLAAQVMEDVTVKLAELMELKIEKQRLDSTHIFSDMACLGRLRLMKTVIKRFLTQVKRHDQAGYDLLEESFRDRYGKDEKKVFAFKGLDEEARKLLRQRIAEDLYFLINHFADHPQHTQRSTYKDMDRVFSEQCQVDEGAVQVRKETGGNIMVNPSDSDATLDGHKGVGYQVQLTETCDPENEVQLITSAIPQTAVESDSESLLPILEQLDKQGLKPTEMVADTAYCSDKNVQKAAQHKVALLGPAPGQCKDDRETKTFSALRFTIDVEQMTVTHCPAGHCPLSSRYVHDEVQGREKIYTVMDGTVCQTCDMQGRCPGTFSGQGTSWSPLTYRIYHEASAIRLSERRIYEQTDAFKDRYRIRSGIEGTNSGLKRKVGLGRLRVRGRPSVFRAILLKVAGWNMHRASCCAKIHDEVAKRASEAFFYSFFPSISEISPYQSNVIALDVKMESKTSLCVSGDNKAKAA